MTNDELRKIMEATGVTYNDLVEVVRREVGDPLGIPNASQWSGWACQDHWTEEEKRMFPELHFTGMATDEEARRQAAAEAGRPEPRPGPDYLARSALDVLEEALETSTEYVRIAQSRINAYRTLFPNAKTQAE